LLKHSSYSVDEFISSEFWVCKCITQLIKGLWY
jgi:hypothetical protein